MTLVNKIYVAALLGMATFAQSNASLTENSPFLPPDFSPGQSSTPSQANTPSSPVERLLDFKGWYEISGEKRFLVSMKRRSDGGWMRMGKSRDEITLMEFDPGAERVRVQFQGNEGWLEMAKLENNSGSGVASQDASSSTPTPTTRPATTPTRGRVSPVPQRRTVTSASSRGSSAAEGPRLATPPRVVSRGNQNLSYTPPSRIPQPPPTPAPTGKPPTPPPAEAPDAPAP